MKKKIIALFLAVIMTAMVIPSVFTASASPTAVIMMDGVDRTSETSPTIVSNTVLVPMRFINEAFGADVSWNATTRRATLRTAAYTVVFTVGSRTFTVNGTNHSAAVAPRITDNRTMIPLRAFADAIGATTSHNTRTHTTTINYFSAMTGSIIVTGSTTVQPIAQAAADKLVDMNKDLTITVSGGGSGAGINAARDGTAHIGMSSRELTATELSRLNAYPVANDGVVIIVHPNNTVSNLTVEQARDIFTGTITNWKDVGGSDAAILVQTRATGSGTLDALNGLVLGSGNSVTSNASEHASNSLMRSTVAGGRNTIGFVSVGHVDDTIKALSINNRRPTATTIANKTYPLSRFIYVCTRGRASGVNAIFIDYLRTKDCQDNIVVPNGFVKLS